VWMAGKTVRSLLTRAIPERFRDDKALCKYTDTDTLLTGLSDRKSPPESRRSQQDNGIGRPDYTASRKK